MVTVVLEGWGTGEMSEEREGGAGGGRRRGEEAEGRLR